MEPLIAWCDVAVAFLRATAAETVARGDADAIAEIQQNAGRQFDPQVAAEAAVLLRGLGDSAEAIEPHLLVWTDNVESAREARTMMQRSRPREPAARGDTPAA